jgi:hypothetical protein
MHSPGISIRGLHGENRDLRHGTGVGKQESYRPHYGTWM